MATAKKSSSPKGGKYPRGGRPKGAKDKLGPGSRGQVKALKTLRKRYRVPEDAEKELAELADEGFDTIVDVMRGNEPDPRQGRVRLAAATAIREEVCGPVAKKVQHEGTVSIEIADPYAGGEDG